MPAPSRLVASEGCGRGPRARAPAAWAKGTHSSPSMRSSGGCRTNCTRSRPCRRQTSSHRAAWNARPKRRGCR
eukprot:11207522-Lingulodinium_polyedra.AAC.1